MAKFVNTYEGRIKWIHHLITDVARPANGNQYPIGEPYIVIKYFYHWVFDDIHIRQGCEDVTIEWVAEVINDFLISENPNCRHELLTNP